MIAHMQVFACMCLSSELSEKGRTSGHRKMTQKVHTRVSPASLVPRLLRFRKEFLLNIEFMCVFMHLCTCPVTVVDLCASFPGSFGGGGKKSQYTLLGACTNFYAVLTAK